MQFTYDQNLMVKDRYRLYRLKKDNKQELYQQLLEKSQQQVQNRQLSRPKIHLNQDLPVTQYADKLIKAIQQHQVIIVAGETGSGKTTQLPQIALLANRGMTGLIGHTQPRRLAARSVSQRIADELGEPLGKTVSFKVRFNEQGNDDSLIRLMTDGILLAELAHDRYLTRYDTIIIDEAHERSLNIDFLLGYIKSILPKRPDLKVIITSATLDIQRFSTYFNHAPIFSVEGRSFPVEVRYRPVAELNIRGSDDDEFDEFEENLPYAVIQAIEECFMDARQQGEVNHADILIFVSTEQEIKELQEIIQKQQFQHTEVLALYARLALSEQQKIFNPSGVGRRIIIATNVAETALTVPNIRYVIDSGFARISRYNYRSRVQRLPIEAISQAAANQRKGRCGRIASGLCIRLYSEEDFNARPAFTEPEIKRTNLASVILQMENLGLGKLESFDFIEPPDQRLINDGRKLLKELGALKDHRVVHSKQRSKTELTQVGMMMAKMPIDPRLARMLIAGHHFGVLSEVLIIVSALAVQDPRERPMDKQMQADQKHALFKAEHSDFLFYVNLWKHLQALKYEQQLSENKRRLFAKQHFLSWLRLREWQQTYQQLLEMTKQLGMSLNEKEGDYENIHRALLTGLLSFIANKTEERNVFMAIRQQKARIFPASTLHKTNTPWVMAFEMVETSQVYLRTLAKIEPEWVISAAGDLLKYHYFEPHWSKKSGLVHAYAQISLFGLILEYKRRIQYEKIDLVNAHEIFVRDALVMNQLGIMPPFLQHNIAKLAEVEKIEDKLRRRDLTVDEEQIYQFYAERIDKTIASRQSFEAWRAKIEAQDRYYLYFKDEDIWKKQPPTTQQFPDQLKNGALKFAVKYHFNPNHERDGAVVTVPIHALSQMDIQQWSWGILGWRLNLIESLLKSLPKEKRRLCVPIPDTAKQLMSKITAQDEQKHIVDVLAYYLRGDHIYTQDFDLSKVDDYLRPFIYIVDAKGFTVDQGRDLGELQIRCQEQCHETLITSDVEYMQFPEQFQFEHQQKVTGVVVKQYQVIVPKIAFSKLDANQKTGVIIQAFNDEKFALQRYREGIIHLVYLQLGDMIRQLKKQISKNLALAYSPLGQKSQLEQMLIYATLQCSIDSLPMNHHDFQQLIKQVRTIFLVQGQKVLGIFNDIFSLWQDIRTKISDLNPKIFKDHLDDIHDQLELMQLDQCFYMKHVDVWVEYPRYLKALQLRLERLPHNIQRDYEFILLLDEWVEKLFTLYDKQKLDAQFAQKFYQLVEEYRISLFSQPMKTKIPVSVKRLQQAWDLID